MVPADLVGRGEKNALLCMTGAVIACTGCRLMVGAWNTRPGRQIEVDYHPVTSDVYILRQGQSFGMPVEWIACHAFDWRPMIRLDV